MDTRDKEMSFLDRFFAAYMQDVKVPEDSPAGGAGRQSIRRQ
jgi:hypothetical protein